MVSWQVTCYCPAGRLSLRGTRKAAIWMGGLSRLEGSLSPETLPKGGQCCLSSPTAHLLGFCPVLIQTRKGHLGLRNRGPRLPMGE